MALKSKYISKLGLELEGGWDKVPEEEGVIIGHDGSVMRPISSVTGKACRHYGELASPPLPLEKVAEWLKKYYPTGVNNSCGFHVHFSLRKNLDYSRLMDRKFFILFHKRAGEWGKAQNLPSSHAFWERLAGKNTYCKKQHVPGKQVYVAGKGGERYTMLNYCYSLHSTIECRLAPGWETFELALSWVEFLIETVNLYLREQPKEKVMTLLLAAKDVQVMGEVKKDLESLRKSRDS